MSGTCIVSAADSAMRWHYDRVPARSTDGGYRNGSPIADVTLREWIGVVFAALLGFLADVVVVRLFVRPGHPTDDTAFEIALVLCPATLFVCGAVSAKVSERLRLGRVFIVIFVAFVAVFWTWQAIWPGDPGEVHAWQPDQLLILSVGALVLAAIWFGGARLGRFLERR